VLIATNHDAYDYDFILRHAPLLVDTKNVFVRRAEYPDKIYMA
jgi:UDP-N-acetyl-D-mannosaminuronate dehydrogenase